MAFADWRRTANGQGPVAAFVAFAFVVLYTLCVAAVPIRADNDCWWHVKSGQYIAQFGLPERDVFSYTAADREWHNHEWLTQVAAWRIFEFGESTALGGWRATILATGLTFAASFCALLLLAGRLSRNWWIALFVVVVAVGIGRRTFAPRPPAVSNLLLAVELLLIVGAQEGWWRRAWLWVLPPMVALWTNLHGGWMAGGVVLAAFAGQDFVGWIAHRVRSRLSPAAASRLATCGGEPRVSPAYWTAVGLATLAATLCNPYGWRLYELPARVMSDGDLVSKIGELRPPLWKFAYDTPMAVGLVLAGIAYLVAVRRSTAWFRLGEAAVFAFFLWQGAMHVRHLLLFAAMMVPMAARVAAVAATRKAEGGRQKAEGKKDEGGGMRDEDSGSDIEYASSAMTTALPHGRATESASAFCLPPSAFRLPPSAFLLLSLLWAGMILRNWPEGQGYVSRHADYWRDRTGYIPQNFPEALCDFVDLAGIEGRMFNENHYAGYLIWRWSPDKRQVFSDPRFDIFGGDIWREEAIVQTAFEPKAGAVGASWRDVLDKWDVQWAIVTSPPLEIHPDTKRPTENQPMSALEYRLGRSDSGWRLVADWSAIPNGASTFQIWMRDTPANEATIQRARRMFEGMARVELAP